MVYSQNDDMLYGITVYNVEELAELFSIDTEIYEPLFIGLVLVKHLHLQIA